jgi:hypothetical protein
VASSATAPRAQIDTSAPAVAKASAIARPMPRLPPATSTRLCVKSNPIDVPCLLRIVPRSWARPSVTDV